VARSFDGIDDRIDLANEANFDRERTDPFSIAFPFYLPANTSGAYVAKQVNSGNFEGWSISNETFEGPRIVFELRNSAGNQILREIDVAHATATWIHVLCTYSGSSTLAGTKIYLNGAEAAYQAGTADSLSASILNNVACQFGCRGGSGAPGFFHAASLADGAFWNVELNATEAHMLGNGAEPSTIRGANQIALLRLCGTDSPEIDDWGTNDGTVTGTTTVAHPLNSPSACNPQPILRTVTSGLRW